MTFSCINFTRKKNIGRKTFHFNESFNIVVSFPSVYLVSWFTVHLFHLFYYKFHAQFVIFFSFYSISCENLCAYFYFTNIKCKDLFFYIFPKKKSYWCTQLIRIHKHWDYSNKVTTTWYSLNRFVNGIFELPKNKIVHDKVVLAHVLLFDLISYHRTMFECKHTLQVVHFNVVKQ